MPQDIMPSAEGLSIIGILLASLLGSTHCALMCGGFVAVIQNREGATKALIFYHIGRLIAYAVLGVAAGYLGREVNAISGIGSFAGVLAAIWFVGQTIRVYLPNAPIKIGETRPHGIFTKIFEGVFDKPLLFGLTAGILPCGWLYSNILLAGAIGEPVYGAAYMFFFWLGTIPALQSVVFCSNIIRRVLPTRSRLFISTLYLLFAIISLSLHLSLVGHKDKTACHSHDEKHLAR